MSSCARFSWFFTRSQAGLAAFTVVLLSVSSSTAQQGTQPLSFDAAAPHARSIPEGTLRIVVPEFADNGSSEELEFLRTGLPLLLRVSLLSQPGIDFVEGTTPAAGEPSGQEDSKLYGADFLLQGSYFYYRGSIRLDAEVRELHSDGRMNISSGVVPLEDLYSAVNDLATNLKKSLPELRKGSGAKRIAVACFANVSELAIEQQAWIGDDLGKYLSSHLLSGEDIAVLPWNEAKQGCVGGNPRRRPQALLAELGADALLTGQFKVSAQEISVFPELFLASREAPLPFPVVTHTASRLLEIEDLITEDTQDLLGVLLDGKNWRLEPFVQEIGVEEAAERATSLLQRNEDLALALWLFHRVVALAPGDPRGHAGVGACRLAHGRYGQALRELSLAAQIAPDRADIQKLLGDVYLKLNRVQDAVDAYSRAAAQAPDSPEYPLKLGIALHLKGDYPRALEVLQTALQKGAPPAAARVAMANVQRSAGAFHQAAVEFREALAASPDSHEAQLGLSEVLLTQASSLMTKRDYDAALDLIRQAIELNPSTQGYARLSFVLTEKHQYEQAVLVTQEAEQAGLTNATVFHNRAFALSKLGRRDEALKAYDEVLRLTPDNAPTLLNKANLLIQMNRQPEARELLGRISPDKAAFEIRVRIATALAKMEDYPAALSEVEAILKLDPKSPIALNAKGFVLNRTGRFNEALDVFNAAIRLNPDIEGLHTNRAYALGELGRYEDAIAAADRAIAISSIAAAPRNHKGYYLYLLGKEGEGLQLIQEAIALDSNYGGSHFNLARIYARQGRTEQALSELATAFDLDLRYRTLVLQSPEFGPLRLDPSFQHLLARFQPPDMANP